MAIFNQLKSDTMGHHGMAMNTLPIKELRLLLAAVANHGEQHLAEVEADLQQTTFLLNEAIEKLSASFLAVHELTCQQQQLIENSQREKQVSAALSNALDGYKDQIGHQVNAMVTGLQFQDMTNQLLQRTIKRVNGLKDLLQELSAHGYDMAAEQEHDDIVKFLASINESFDAGSHALSGNLRKAVGQHDMATGDIDLF
ncbi:MAG: chemotaxis protein [Methylophilus sp.]|nr:chemotaxis protein [Methylophilus sp.]